MYISIGLTVHNRWKLAEHCIRSIFWHTPKGEYELIVVDNNSDWQTTSMLVEFYRKGYIDKLLLRPDNNLGSAINLQWELADPSAEWLLTLDNDNLCMPGWLGNFRTVARDVLPDFMFTQIRMPLFHREIPYETVNGGNCLSVSRLHDIPYGAGLAISKYCRDYHQLKFPEGNEPWSIGNAQGSIYTVMGLRLKELNLKYVDLGKPCILAQDCEYANFEYYQYYSKIFGYKGRLGSGRYGVGGAKMSKFRSLRIRGGNTRYPDEYYKGCDYKIGKHWREALESEEGQALWDEPMYEAPKDWFKNKSPVS